MAPWFGGTKDENLRLVFEPHPASSRGPCAGSQLATCLLPLASALPPAASAGALVLFLLFFFFCLMFFPPTSAERKLKLARERSRADDL